ncbi:hypothetical protein KC330_g143 [Hortaea werneckii]|nr:hypothetical protein KC330_g143 [Hortaea werneckii]
MIVSRKEFAISMSMSILGAMILCTFSLAAACSAVIPFCKPAGSGSPPDSILSTMVSYTLSGLISRSRSLISIRESSPCIGCHHPRHWCVGSKKRRIIRGDALLGSRIDFHRW